MDVHFWRPPESGRIEHGEGVTSHNAKVFRKGTGQLKAVVYSTAGPEAGLTGLS